MARVMATVPMARVMATVPMARVMATVPMARVMAIAVDHGRTINSIHICRTLDLNF
jgi:hypothetical protein